MELERHSILVIMANSSVLTKVSHLFAASGATVYGTGCSEEALHQLHDHSPDLIIMDHALSDPIRQTIRERTRGRAGTPVLLLSVLRADCFGRGDAGAGSFCYVTMPFDPEVLLARARAALKRTSLASRRPGAQRRAPTTTRFAAPTNNTGPSLRFSASGFGAY